jgi:hypothetical protein
MLKITKRSKQPSLLTMMPISRGAGTGAAVSQSAVAPASYHNQGNRLVRAPLKSYGRAISIICAGFAMLGVAQALRLLLFDFAYMISHI